MDREVGEVLGEAAGGAPGAFWHQGQGTVRYGMLLPVHPDETPARYADDDHLHLVVDVLADAAARPETEQVGVELAGRP